MLSCVATFGCPKRPMIRRCLSRALQPTCPRHVVCSSAASGERFVRLFKAWSNLQVALRRNVPIDFAKLHDDIDRLSRSLRKATVPTSRIENFVNASTATTAAQSDPRFDDMETRPSDAGKRPSLQPSIAAIMEVTIPRITGIRSCAFRPTSRGSRSECCVARESFSLSAERHVRRSRKTRRSPSLALVSVAPSRNRAHDAERRARVERCR